MAPTNAHIPRHRWQGQHDRELQASLSTRLETITPEAAADFLRTSEVVQEGTAHSRQRREGGGVHHGNHCSNHRSCPSAYRFFRSEKGEELWEERDLSHEEIREVLPHELLRRADCAYEWGALHSKQYPDQWWSAAAPATRRSR